MTYSSFVDVLDASNELLENSYSCFLMETLLLHNIIEKLPIDAILHDQIQLCLSLDDFIQLDDVRVPHLLQNLDLARDASDILPIFNASFFQYFDCNLFLGQNVLSQFNFSESSFAERLA